MLRHAWLILPLALFVWGAVTGPEAHGLYMDAVNPDYLVARWLGSKRTEILPWVLPGNLLFGRFPVLIQLYHGALPFWFGLPGYLLLGTDVTAVRLVHAGFGTLVLASLYAFLLAFGVGRLAATAALCVLALDPSLLLAFRTQSYITLLPFAFVLISAALTQTARWRWSLLAAGFCAGLAVHGYFIHGAFFLVLLVHVAMRREARGFCEWLLGAALAGSVYPLGFAAAAAAFGLWGPAILAALAWFGGLGLLAWVTVQPRPLRMLAWAALLVGVGAFLVTLLIPAELLARILAPFQQHVAHLDPGRSTLSFAERVALLGHLARLALSGGGGIAMLLGGGTHVEHATLRAGLALAIVALGIAAGLWSRPARVSRGVLLVLALLAAHLLLALAFGDRLWVQHVVAVPVLVAALLGFALQAIPARQRLAVLALLALPLGALGAMDRATILAALERTGGVGLSSDATTRFARDVARETPGAMVRAPDWGISMPFVMVTGGNIGITPVAPIEAMRADLCAGRPAVLALLAEGAEARLAEYIAALGPPRLTRYAQRDGTPVLISALWAPSCADAATNPAPAPAPAAAR